MNPDLIAICDECGQEMPGHLCEMRLVESEVDRYLDDRNPDDDGEDGEDDGRIPPPEEGES